MKPHSKAADIKRMVKEGMKYKQILDVDGYESCARIIRQLMIHRPRMVHKPVCALIWGGTGLGKTDTVRHAIDDYISANGGQDEGIEYHIKGAGWAKWHDGYDCHEIEIIDDAFPFRQDGLHQEATEWLQLLGNRGPHVVQVKGASVPFLRLN